VAIANRRRQLNPTAQNSAHLDSLVILPDKVRRWPPIPVGLANLLYPGLRISPVKDTLQQAGRLHLRTLLYHAPGSHRTYPGTGPLTQVRVHQYAGLLESLLWMRILTPDHLRTTSPSPYWEEIVQLGRHAQLLPWQGFYFLVFNATNRPISAGA